MEEKDHHEETVRAYRPPRTDDQRGDFHRRQRDRRVPEDRLVQHPYRRRLPEQRLTTNDRVSL